jgi:hypothetical protein
MGIYAWSLLDSLEGRLVLLHRSGYILVNAFDKPLWSSDLLLGHTEGLGHEGVVLHLGVVAHLDSFIECLR